MPASSVQPDPFDPSGLAGLEAQARSIFGVRAPTKPRKLGDKARMAAAISSQNQLNNITVGSQKLQGAS